MLLLAFMLFMLSSWFWRTVFDRLRARRSLHGQVALLWFMTAGITLFGALVGGLGSFFLEQNTCILPLALFAGAFNELYHALDDERSDCAAWSSMSEATYS